MGINNDTTVQNKGKFNPSTGFSPQNESRLKYSKSRINNPNTQLEL